MSFQKKSEVQRILFHPTRKTKLCNIIDAVDFDDSNTAGSFSKVGRTLGWRVHTELGCWSFLIKMNMLIPPWGSSRFGGMISSKGLVNASLSDIFFPTLI